MACLPFPKNQKNFSLLIIFLHFLQTTEQVSNVGPSKNEKTPTIKCSKCPSSKSRSKTLLVSVKLSDNAILSVLFCLSNVFVYFDIVLFWFGASSKHLQRNLLSPTNKSSSVESAVYRSIFSEPKTETFNLKPMYILRGLIFTPVILMGLSLLQVGEGSFIIQGEGKAEG